MPDIGVLILHGMGDQKEDYAADFTRRLERELSRLDTDPARVAWGPVWWARVLNRSQEQLLRDARRRGPLGWRFLRRPVVTHLGDAAAYQRGPREHGGTYEKIHAEVGAELRALRDDLGRPDAPLLAIGHSLGSVILSNYIWDEQRRKPWAQSRGADPFLRLDTLAGLVTFGSTLPLFTMQCDHAEPIEFPPKGLAEPLRRAARWLNLYDPDDVLGWPLATFAGTNGRQHPENRAINVGGLFSSWNPRSHGEYWTDRDFVRPVARLIVDILEAAERGAPSRYASAPAAT